MTGPLTTFGDNLWLADGSTVAGAGGFHFPTRMAVARLPDGALWLWSPVAPDAGLIDAIRALGPVGHLVAPNTLHHLFALDWHAAFPDARLFIAPGLRAKRPDLGFATDLTLEPPAEWQGAFDQVAITGNRILTEVAFFHRQSRTAIFTDLIQQMPRDQFRGWRAWIARADGMTAPRPTVPRKFRISFRDKTALRGQIGQVLGWGADRLVYAHGAAVPSGGGQALEQAFRWLRP